MRDKSLLGTSVRIEVRSLASAEDDALFALFPAGPSLLELFGGAAAQVHDVRIGGAAVPATCWSRVRPRPGVIVQVTLIPQGGGGGGKFLRLIGMGALVWLTAGIAGGALIPALAAGSTGALAAAAGAGLVGSLLLNALVPPTTPKSHASADSGDTINSLTGTSNNAAPGSPIPIILGEVQHYFPTHAALPYTEILGSDQYLRMLLDLGYGDVTVSDIMIGETAIGDYHDISWEIGTNPSLYTQDVYELTVGTNLNNDGDSDQRTSQNPTDELSIDLQLPAGLYAISKKGKMHHANIHLRIQFRPSGSGDWLNPNDFGASASSGILSSDGGGNYTLSAKESKPMRVGLHWTLPSRGQYDVQITRVSSDSGKDDFSHNLTWSVLRSISHQSASNTGTLKLALRIKATDQLNGTVSTVNCRVGQQVKRWDQNRNVWMADAVTSNPAWVALWLLTECPAVARRLDPQRIDLYGFAEWAGLCEDKGYRVSQALSDAQSLGDLYRNILSCGRASFGTRNGLYTPVVDTPQTVPVQMFTPANSWGYSYERSFVLLPHALRVSFTNPAAKNQTDEIVVYDDGYDAGNATRFERLDLRLVDDANAAWRLGRYHLAVGRLRPGTHTINADVEHLVCERGDLVMLATDIMAYGLAYGRLTHVDSNHVTLDGEITLPDGETCTLRVRDNELRQMQATITGIADDHRTLTLDQPLAAAMGDVYVVGVVDHGAIPVIVKSVEPADDMAAKLTLVDAVPAIWTADSGEPPPFTSQITGQPWCAPPDPPDVHITGGDSINDAGVATAGAGVGVASSSGIYRMPLASGCVVVESVLLDGRRAGDLVVGDTLELADAITLAATDGVVTYSETIQQPCIEITTVSGIRLRCSTAAPLPTRRHGLVLAPHLAGREVAVKDAAGVRWEAVKRMRTLGRWPVQHISVSDGCFWAGADHQGYILHHNKPRPA